MLLSLTQPFELWNPWGKVFHNSKMFRAGTVFLAVAGFAGGVFAFDPSALTEVGLNLSEVNSYSHSPFANSLLTSYGNWLECSSSNNWGTSVAIWSNAQFDVNGYPQYLKPGTTLRGVVFANATTYANRPSTWPFRGGLARGKVLVTWHGDADIRAAQGTFVSGESNGSSTGRLVNGRRTYMCTNATSYIQSITVNDINSNSPPTDIKVWLPDPANPNGATLEGQYFHPTYLARLADARWAFFRFVKWTEVINSPQHDWSDRRLPTHVFQQGILNPRSPVTGGVSNKYTGVAYEHAVALCNTSGVNPWINVPHLATDDYITKMAQVFRYGSDGVNPYTNDVSNPVYPPLNTNLVLYVEYSNEIWNDLYGETPWAQAQAAALGITPQQFVARRFCDTWRIFQSVFGGTNRLVRAAVVGTGQQTYTTGLLNEIAAYGPTLTPPQTADIVAPTTYFGNGIQDWAYSRAQQQAGTADPWFFTTNTFLDGTATKPVSVAPGDPYWTGTNISRHLDQTFTEWKRRLLSGSAQTGGGPDANGVGGGFDVWLRTAITNAFGVMKPLVTYEGGPSIYTDIYDGGDVRDDGITTFCELLNRQPGMRDVYRIHLNMAKAKGLRTHGAFNEVEGYGKYGQWGHLEYLDQPPTNSVKWTFLWDWFTETSHLRPVDNPLNAMPSFTTAANLPMAVYLQPYTNDIAVTGGDGTNTLDVVGSLLPTGLSVTNVAGDTNRLRIGGTPLASGDGYVYARVRDADGDPAWRTFYFHTAGGPGVILENSFAGTNLAQHLPWTSAYVLSNGVTFSGWNKGAGIIAQAGTNALVWQQYQSTNESYSTLASAIASNEYWAFTLTPVGGQPLNLRKAEVRFAICRIGYNAMRDYAVLTSVGGFATGAQVFDTGHFTDQTGIEFIFNLPDTAAYGNLTTPVEFRLVGYSGQNASPTSLTAFKLTGFPGPSITTSGLMPSGTVGVSYSAALSASGGATPYSWSIASGGLPDGLNLSSSTGVISGSPTAYGTWDFTIQAADANSLTTTQPFSLIINPTAWQAWQLHYFGATSSPQAAPDADPLGKGMRNYDQFLAGLNPTNADSVFRITSMLLTGADFVVRWKTAGVRTNIVQSANAAWSNGFQDVGTPVIISGSGDTTTAYTVVGGATNATARFYRIRIWP